MLLQSGLALLDGLELRLRAPDLRGQLDGRPFHFLLPLGQGSLPRADGLSGLLQLRLQGGQVAVPEADLFRLRLDLCPGGRDLTVQVPQLGAPFLDGDLAGRDLGEFRLQVLRLVLELLLQGFQMGLPAAEGPFLVVQGLPFLLVVLLDHGDLRVVGLQDFPLVHGGRGRDDMEKGARDLGRQSANPVRADEQGARRDDGELAEECDVLEDHQDGQDEGGSEARKLARTEALPGHPHGDDRERQPGD